jgi:hypothetical protein
MVSQEILTKPQKFSQEILTKKWAFWACLVKKPLQKPFYRKIRLSLFDKLEEFITKKQEGCAYAGKKRLRH